MMRRIQAAMPVLIVPLIAHEVKRAGGSVAPEVLARNVADTAARVRGSMPSFDTDKYGQALAQMTRHRIIEEHEGLLRVVPGEEAVLEYYAASVEEKFAIETGDMA
jgi:glycerol-3-phosphate O-acyltransferase